MNYMDKYSTPEHQDTRKATRKRGAFQAKMFTAIMKHKPEYFGIVTRREDGGMPDVKQDPATLKLFEPTMSTELMFSWESQGQPDMTDFLRNEGFAI